MAHSDRTATDLENVDPVVESYKRHVDRSLLRRNLEKTVGERVAALIALQRLAEEAKRAGVRVRRAP